MMILPVCSPKPDRTPIAATMVRSDRDTYERLDAVEHGRQPNRSVCVQILAALAGTLEVPLEAGGRKQAHRSPDFGLEILDSGVLDEAGS